MKVETPVVTTPTRVELAQRCERRHVLTDVIQVGKWHSAAAALGNVMHVGAATWWKTADLSAALAAARRDYDNRFTPELIPKPGKNSWDVIETLLPYYTREAKLAGPLTVLGGWETLLIEERRRLPIGGYTLSFQLDRLLHRDNQLLLVDLKTASRLDKEWADQWKRSIQFRLYRYAIGVLFSETNVDIIVEGIEKSTTKPKLEYVLLPEWSDDYIAEALTAFVDTAARDAHFIEIATLSDGSLDVDKLIELAVNTTRFNYGDCHSFYFECPFLQLCNADPSERKQILADNYVPIEQEY